MKMEIKYGDKALALNEPKVMGILNYNPDSFYDGGKYSSQTEAIRQIELMIREGASIIDIGGMSSKPGAEIISSEEELKRILPLLKEALALFPDAFFSIDTIHAETAIKCLDEGVQLINDISGGSYDSKMFDVIARYKVPFVMMHMRGTPENMQSLTSYNDIIAEMKSYFEQKMEACERYGIEDVIIDPGFGFAKTMQQNFFILKHLSAFSYFQKPILAGLSRKSMIYKTLGNTAEEALNGTTSLNMVALLNGAKILRVHDVKAATETVKLFSAYQQA